MKVNIMRKLILVLGLAIVASCATAQAATHELDMTKHQAVSPAATHKGTGLLKAVNTGKVQIAHQAITSLGWPAMTMWFTLRVPLPEGTRVGDDMRFELEQVNSKEWVITRIERKR